MNAMTCALCANTLEYAGESCPCCAPTFINCPDDERGGPIVWGVGVAIALVLLIAFL